MSGGVVAIEPSVTQSGKHFVQIIEWSPCAEIGAEIAFTECRPQFGAVGESSHIVAAPRLVALVVGLGAKIQLLEHVFHSSATLLVACSGIYCEGRQIVSSHVSVEAVPVRIGGLSRFKPGFLAIGSEHSIAVIFQKCFDVQVTSFFQRTVEQLDVAERKFVAV